MNAHPTAPSAALLNADPLWYKDAVIYQLHIKSFYRRQWRWRGRLRGAAGEAGLPGSNLGVDTIWLLPFYPSPRRDDGYDIADYRSVHPDYGTLTEARRFVAAAHARGLRVITELVINHTSDQHPWFQRARKRQARLGGPQLLRAVRQRPVLRRHPHHLLRHREVQLELGRRGRRLLRHRFYSHQPDLNFDNPQVLNEVLSVMRFWLDIGIDGLRLDAVPYLVEREGTTNENLAETHEVIRKIRSHLDERYTGRLLLAEANHVAGGRPAVLRRRQRRRHGRHHRRGQPGRRRGGRRMPHGLPLPADAAHVHGHRPGRPLPDHRHHAADPRGAAELPVGDLPAQPRRTDAGNGHQQRARLPLGGLRLRPPRAYQPRHPPPAGAADGARPPPHRADEQPAVLDARHAGDLLRRRDRHGRQHPPRRPRRRAHADAVVAGPQRRLLPRRPRAAGAAAAAGAAVRL